MSQLFCDPNLPPQWQARERQLQAQRQAEKSMREERQAEPAANGETLRSIAIERARLGVSRFYSAYGRRHPDQPKGAA